MPIRARGERAPPSGALPQFQGIAPQPVGAGFAAPWEDRFLETDGWDYQDLAIGGSDPKWWHVPDEKISELIKQQQSEIRRSSMVPKTLAVQTQLVELDEESLGEESASHVGADRTDEAADHVEPDQASVGISKTWKVSDDAISKLIQDMETKQAGFHQTSAELLSMNADSARRPVPKPRLIGRSVLECDLRWVRMQVYKLRSTSFILC